MNASAEPDSAGLSNYVIYRIVNTLMILFLLSFAGGIAVFILTSQGYELAALRVFVGNYCPWVLMIGRCLTRIKGFASQDPFQAFFMVLGPVGLVLTFVAGIAQIRFFSDQVARAQIDAIKSPNKRLRNAILPSAILAAVFAYFVGAKSGMWIKLLIFAAVFTASFWYARRKQTEALGYVDQFSQDGFTVSNVSEFGDIVGEGNYRGLEARVVLDRPEHRRLREPVRPDESRSKLDVIVWAGLPAPKMSIVSKEQAEYIRVPDESQFDLPELNDRGFLVKSSDQAASKAFVRARMGEISRILENADALIIDQSDDNDPDCSISLTAVSILSEWNDNAIPYKPLLDPLVDLVEAIRPS